MQEADGGASALTPHESWQAIHATVDKARNAMHVAGTAPILLLWGVITALGVSSQYAIEILAPAFVQGNSWINAPLWGALVTAGMVGSAVIGHRAGSQYADGAAINRAGIRVFLFWLAVVLAAFFVPAAAGMWTAEAAANIPRVSLGIVALGYVLFGIVFRPVIAVVGGGIAVAFYVPSFLAGAAAPMVSAVALLAVAALGAAWIRKSGVR